jgi:hypothetical protein
MSSLVEKVMALADAFDRSGTSFAFGGALALAYATENPRGTRDMDINVFASPEHARQVLGGHPPGVAWTNDDLRRLGRDDQVRLWWDDTPLDLSFNAGPFHVDLAQRIVRVPFLDHRIPILSADDLAVFKVLSDRDQDWVDLQRMLDAGSIDRGRVARQLKGLLGPDHRIDRLRRLAPDASGD